MPRRSVLVDTSFVLALDNKRTTAERWNSRGS
jgi:hypothetical protein